MTAIISTTFDDKYFYFLPITTWCWNKLGIDVVCFCPRLDKGNNDKAALVGKTLIDNNLRCRKYFFDAPEHKQATYAQCLRLYGGAIEADNDEVFIVGDVDMAVFNAPFFSQFEDGKCHIIGADLVPPNQYPMCYLVYTSLGWWKVMDVGANTYQQCVDELLGQIESTHFRGNFWAKDQETAFNHFSNYATPIFHNRAREGTQFASNRLDRDDAYILERDVAGVIDYHMNRPGFEHIETILTIFYKIYPEENFDWIRTYTEEYKKLL